MASRSIIPSDAASSKLPSSLQRLCIAGSQIATYTADEKRHVFFMIACPRPCVRAVSETYPLIAASSLRPGGRWLKSTPPPPMKVQALRFYSEGFSHLVLVTTTMEMPAIQSDKDTSKSSKALEVIAQQMLDIAGKQVIIV